MTSEKQYVVPVTLPFSEAEAVSLLESAGYRAFEHEAVKGSSTLCTTAPDGRRISVAEAMKIEVATALKRLLRSDASPLRLEPTPASEPEAIPAERFGVPADDVRWARHCAAEYDRELDVLPLVSVGSIEFSPEALNAATVAGYVEEVRGGFRGLPHINITEAGQAAMERLLRLARAVLTLRDQNRGHEQTLATLCSWGVMQKNPPRPTCIGRVIDTILRLA